MAKPTARSHVAAENSNVVKMMTKPNRHYCFDQKNKENNAVAVS